MGFVYPPETYAGPDYDGDSDYEDAARERELMLADLADYNDDFSRSNDEVFWRENCLQSKRFFNNLASLLSCRASVSYPLSVATDVPRLP